MLIGVRARAESPAPSKIAESPQSSKMVPACSVAQDVTAALAGGCEQLLPQWRTLSQRSELGCADAKLHVEAALRELRCCGALTQTVTLAATEPAGCEARLTQLGELRSTRNCFNE